MFRSMFLVGLVAAIGIAVASPSVVGAKGKPGGSNIVPGITMNQTDPHLGDWVKFTYTAPDGVKYPRIQVVCTQDGAVVYGEAGPASDSFKLGGGSSTWLDRGGEADCTATLYSWDFTPRQVFNWYADTKFHAGGAR